MIDGKKLFEQMLKLPIPWEVAEVKIDEEAQEIKVYMDYKSDYFMPFLIKKAN